MIGIEIFSGAGGMGLGATQAGIDVRIAIEKDKYAAQTYLFNHPKTTVVVDDVSNIKEFKLLKKKEQLVLFGGPPCQGYSNSNRKTRTSENPKNWLFKEFMRSVKLTNPDWIVIENVPGLQNLEKGFFLEQICNDLLKLGYTPNIKILNAVNYGVPQKRERIFIVGSKNGAAFEFPIGEYENNHVTIRDAISDLPILENGSIESLLSYKHSPKSEFAKMMRGDLKKSPQNYVTKNSTNVLERYNHIPEGGNWQNIPIELMSNYKDHTRCHHNIYRRLSSSEPSPIISNYRKSMIIHPFENRGISLREAARLQSFPDNYIFCGPLIYKQQQVGDAVPPLLAKAIFNQILKFK